MKSVVLFVGAVAAAGKIGTTCTKTADCDTTAKGDLAEVCQTTKIAIVETKVCTLKKTCEASAKATQVAGTTVTCGATYLAAAATLLALGSQL